MQILEFQAGRNAYTLLRIQLALCGQIEATIRAINE
jgi:hypothetical protein